MANDEMLEVHIGRGIGIGYDTPIIDYNYNIEDNDFP